MYKTHIGGRSHSSTTENSLDFYTNKTEQYLRTLSYWALMKHQALLAIQAKLKLTKLVIILFHFSVAIDWQIPRKRVARGARKL